MSNPQDPYHNLFRNKNRGQRYKVNRRLNKTKAEEADKIIKEWKKKAKPLVNARMIEQELQKKSRC